MQTLLVAIPGTVAGREIQLYRVGAGDSCILSSTCLLGSIDYDAHGVALTDSTIFVLPRPIFEWLLAGSDVFRRYVFRLFAELGSVREMVSRIVGGFADRGLLKSGREHITILDEAGLRRVSGVAASEIT